MISVHTTERSSHAAGAQRGTAAPQQRPRVLCAAFSPFPPRAVVQTLVTARCVRAGSSTAVVLCVEGTQLLAANIGDSGFLIVRDGKLEFASPPQQHRFNFPYQIGTRGDPVTACQVRNALPRRAATRSACARASTSPAVSEELAEGVKRGHAHVVKRARQTRLLRERTLSHMGVHACAGCRSTDWRSSRGT